MDHAFLRVLKNKDFSKLWISQLLSQLAYHMLTYMMILHIYDLTKSLTVISLVMIATSIPSVIFGPFSGVFSDRIDKKKILLITNFARFLIVILLIPLVRNTLADLEIIFLLATVTQFFAPAETSSIPKILPENDFVAANSLYMTTMYASLLVGYSVAGPIQYLVGSRLAFTFVAILYLGAAVANFLMTNYDKSEHKSSIISFVKDFSTVWSETKEGIYYLIRNKSVYQPMIRLSLGWAMLGAFVVVLPGFAERDLNISTKLVGTLLIAPAGLGMLIAAYLLDKKKNYCKIRATEIGFLLCGFSLIFFTLFRVYGDFNFSLVIPVLLMIVLGASASIVYISSQTLLHLNSEEKIRGRVFGLSSMLISLAMSLPALFIGGLADLTSPFITLLALSILIVVYGVYLEISHSE